MNLPMTESASCNTPTFSFNGLGKLATLLTLETWPWSVTDFRICTVTTAIETSSTKGVELCLDKASALPLLCPGLYLIPKSNSTSWFTHLCSSDPSFAVCKWLRGLLSVYTVHLLPSRYSQNFSATDFLESQIPTSLNYSFAYCVLLASTLDLHKQLVDICPSAPATKQHPNLKNLHLSPISISKHRGTGKSYKCLKRLLTGFHPLIHHINLWLHGFLNPNDFCC